MEVCNASPARMKVRNRIFSMADGRVNFFNCTSEWKRATELTLEWKCTMKVRNEAISYALVTHELAYVMRSKIYAYLYSKCK